MRYGWPCVCELGEAAPAPAPAAAVPDPEAPGPAPPFPLPGSHRPPAVRALISERVRAGLARLRQTGAAIGVLPYGSRRGPGGRPVPHEEERKVISEIASCYDGGMTLAEICRYLEDASIPPPRGRTWHSSTLREILKRTGRSFPGAQPTTWDRDRALRIAKILQAHERSLRFIAARLAERGMTSPRGRPLSPGTIWYLLRQGRVGHDERSQN